MRQNGSLIDHQSSMTVSSPTVIPNLLDSTRGVNAILHVLREKFDAAKILGLVRCDKAEILLVHDGQYITIFSFVV